MSAISTFLKNRRCAKIRSLLSAYIDGETSTSESRRVQKHLASCAGCAAELESLRATTMLLGSLPQLEPLRSYALTPAQASAATNRRTLPFPAFEAFTGGLVTAGAASLVVALVVGLVFLARLGFIGLADEALPAPAAAPAAPVQQMAAPAAAAPAPAAPAQQMAASAPAAPAAAPVPAPAAPAAASTVAPAPVAAMPQVAPAPTTAAMAAAPAPAAAAHTEAEQEIVKETAIELDSIDDANVETTATATAEAHIAAQATYEAQLAASQAVATAAAQEQVKYATALAQWEAEQAERAEEQAEKQRAIEATYEAQLSVSYAAATARADALVREATAQAKLIEVQAVEVQATEQSVPSEATIPVWVLVMLGGAALAAAAATAFGLMRRRATNNINERNEQDGNH